MLEIEVGYLVSPCVIVEHAVESYRFFGDDGSAEAQLRLKCSGSSYAYHGECAMCVAYFAGGKVDVCQSVELVDYDVDVVRTYAMAEAHDRFPFICAAYGVEFT